MALDVDVNTLAVDNGSVDEKLGAVINHWLCNAPTYPDRTG